MQIAMAEKGSGGGVGLITASIRPPYTFCEFLSITRLTLFAQIN